MHVFLFLNWIHRSSQLGSLLSLEAVEDVARPLFIHVPAQCLFFDPNLSTHQSYLGVRLWKVTELHPHTLRVSTHKITLSHTCLMWLISLIRHLYLRGGWLGADLRHVFKEIGLRAQTLLTFLNLVVNTIRGPTRSFKKRIFSLIVYKIFRSKNCEENHLGLYLDLIFIS